MKRAALYSSTVRTRLPNTSEASGGAAGADRAAANNTSPPAAAAASAAGGTRRARLRALLRRYDRPLLVVAGALIAVAATAFLDRDRNAQRQLTQDDIDAAVLHTMENKTLPSRAAKAAELVRRSVVRVRGYGDEAEDEGSDANKDKGAEGRDRRDSDQAARDPNERREGERKGSERQGNDQARNGGTDRGNDRGSDKNGGRGADKGSDRGADKGADKGSDKNADKDAGKGKGPRERSVGSGVVIVDSGIILTNLHVVAGSKRITVTFSDGMESEAIVVGTKPENDLAVIRAVTIPDDLPAATMGSTAGLNPGDEVVAVGFPFGIGPSVSAGVVSGLNREFRSPEGKRVLTGLIQFDAAANPGNSGGPLVTMSGEVVGIVTAILNPTEARTFIGIGFATTIESAGGSLGISPF